MQPNCIKEASKSCLSSCWVKPLPHSSPPNSGTDPRQDFNSAILSSIQPNTYFTNHESLPSLQEMFTSLNNAIPSYSNTVLADHIRALEYSHLANHVCLDYTGHGLFSYSQLYGSVPYSETASSSSSAADAAPFFDISYSSENLNSYLINRSCQESEFQRLVRKRIMRYMNVFEEDYWLVFTANQSTAFKLLADAYPFHSNQELLTMYDYENEAVQAMIESSKKRGARAQSAVFSWPNLRVNSGKLRKVIVKKSKPKNRGLFVFPLQSRMSGSRYSYQWMNLARENGWHVLLDACALGAKDMETLGLSLFQPDFLICSFFKIFGQNPSGFCSLFIKKSTVPLLNPSSTTMGIVSITPALTTNNDPKSLPLPLLTSEIVEMGSKEIEFRGLDHADRLGLILISVRVRCLVNWLVNALLSLQHPHSGKGQALVTILGPRIMLDRGPAIAFNVHDWKGERVDPNLVQKLAGRNNVSLTIGFLENVWLKSEKKKKKKKMRRKKKGGLWAASIWVGMMNNFEDVYKVWRFVAKFLDADFMEKERWRYTAIDQSTVEV
ncbi:uncharacterized protein LOC127240741 [Andrographis paniculata]|uniref:uncharacterized protein LOC127240741 n=1 Tax=Andrographis paniculata TaxID=175694 RepID=UPI0021E80F10|nr:uncharacterized protein LOC127240741 [Andrographis paniculata]